MADPHPLVERIYSALGTGDKDELREVLSPDFTGEAAAGMPVGAGVHSGPDAMIEEVWWAIGATSPSSPTPTSGSRARATVCW